MFSLKGLSPLCRLTGTTRKKWTRRDNCKQTHRLRSHDSLRTSLNIEKLNPEAKGNPESLLTLKVETLHAVTHLKHPTCLPLQYARDFGSHMLESAKRMARWSAYYFTQPSSYYPVPSSQIDWEDLPRMEPYKELMRKWARDHGKCVRQRTLRQETTKKSHKYLKHTLKKKGRAFRNIGKEKYISLTVKSALLFILFV